MKTTLLIESFGPDKARVSLTPSQGETATILFANLLWVLGMEGERESGTVTRAKLATAIQAFRCANITQERRGKGLWKQSPFSFVCGPQMNDTREVNGGDYGIGNADCQTATDSAFSGFTSRLNLGNAEV